MYHAIVGNVTEVSTIEGADRIQVAYLYDTPCIVGKEVQVGDSMVLFPAGGVISPEFLSANNLYRHSDRNRDQTKVGYFEDNGRVKSTTLRKVKSEGFAVPYTLFQNAYGEIQLPQAGVPFSEIDGKPLCWKFVRQRTPGAPGSKVKKVRFKLEAPTFTEHLETDQYRFNHGAIRPYHTVTVSLKMHGTSGRYGLHEVPRDLSRWERFKQVLGFKVDSTEWKYLVGTRRVVKWEMGEGYHGSDEFRFWVLEQLKPFLKKGMTIYGEIVGWTPSGQKIMPEHKTSGMKDKTYQGFYGDQVSYLYGCGFGLSEFWVYRITDTTQEGEQFDWSPTQIRHFCQERGIKHVYEEAYSIDFRGDEWFINEEAVKNPGVLLGLEESKLFEDPRFPGQVAEGVVVRLDGPSRQARFLKDKTWPFKVMEGIAQEVEDDPEDLS